jgi:glycosyltransferase involved in cell wall biosynthesis
MSSAQPVTLTVVILTFQRPAELVRALPLIVAHVEALNASDDLGVTASILVVDNDAAGSARDAVTSLGSSFVEYVIEPEPGIAAARNRGLDGAADRDLLVFIDDDESPRDGWLSSLVRTWRKFPATAVMGRVISVFADEPEPWIAAGNFFWRPSMPSGTPVRIVAAGNLLLDLHQVRRYGLRFDNRFGLTGGEDTLFSRQLITAGGRMVWCDESEATDFVPPERVTRTWVLARSRRNGNTTTAIDLYLAGSAGRKFAIRLRALAGGAARVVSGIGRWASGLATRSLRHQARGLRLANRGVGMIAAATGTVYEEYARND